MFGTAKAGAASPGFGAKATTATTGFGAKPAGTTGAAGGFGVKPTTAATGFGAKATTATTGTFGAKPAGTTTTGFGAKPAGTTTTGFGAKPAGTTTTTPTLGGFGKTTAATTATGTTATATTATTTTTNGYGRTAGGFGQVSGAAGTTGFSATTGGFAGGASASASNNPDLASLVARITELGNRLHPQSPYCALKYIFYNRVDPQNVKFYRRPETFDPGLWAQAQALNPDPEHLVPHQACGYPDLKARLDAQDSETGSQATSLADAETFIRLKYEEHSLTTALKLDQLKRDSLLLSHRLLTVSSHIEILRARGLAIQPDEDAWRQQLHNLLLQLSKPNEYRGRLNELSSRVRMLQHSHQFDAPLSSSSPSPSGDAFSDSDLTHFTQFLQHQQTGLQHLTDILYADIKNLQSLSDCLSLLKRD